MKTSVAETVKYLKQRLPIHPTTGIFTGTGLGEIAQSVDVMTEFNYRDLPNFPVSTVPSHSGKLIAGQLEGKDVLVMQGRFHLYEGYSPQEVSFPIRIMQELGVKTLIVTNAAGGINPQFKAGDIMIIHDHINLTGFNPLIGDNEDSWGIRFPDMTCVYDQKLMALADQAGQETGIDLHKGVYAGLVGPSLETPAEIRFLKTIGADAVGLSTIMEVVAAVHARMRILGLSTITNLADPDNPQAATVEEIIQVAQEATPKVELIIKAVVEVMDAKI